MPVQRRRLACNVKEVRLECVHTAYKGGLISERFSISKKKCQVTILSNFSLLGERAQDSDLAHLFWRWSQSETLSDIKLPLVKY